jgi:uncharacterized protein YecE (DUF72 family)
MTSGRIRAGIGGWTFQPWRGVFYPHGLKQADELTYAASRLTAIEINGAYYSTFKPDIWARWRAATPAGFRFAVKASRFCTNRKVLGQGGESLEKFLGQGLSELGDRLGPILWQFMATKRFEPDDFEAFLKLLPATQDGLPLTHVVEPRHASFQTPEFIALARKYGVTVCLADHFDYPMISDVTGDLVYARLQTGSDDIDSAYSDADLDLWAARFRTLAQGGQPSDLAYVAPGAPPAATPRDVYVFFIHEGKIRAPAAAMAMIARVER